VAIVIRVIYYTCTSQSHVYSMGQNLWREMHKDCIYAFLYWFVIRPIRKEYTTYTLYLPVHHAIRSMYTLGYAFANGLGTDEKPLTVPCIVFITIFC